MDEYLFPFFPQSRNRRRAVPVLFLPKNCTFFSLYENSSTVNLKSTGGLFMWQEYNPNPVGRKVGDCAVRALTIALNTDWESAYLLAAMNGYQMGDMPSADSVWGAVLRQHGFYRESIPSNCPDCYTAEDFCKDNPHGIFVLGFGGHVAAIKDGILYDSWNSSSEIPQFVWHKKEV